MVEKVEIESIAWKRGFPTAGVKVEVAYKEIERIRQRNGGHVSPEAILNEAENPKNKLHPLFEWDDSKAAAAHRLTQARTLMRSIEVVHKEAPETPMRAYEITTRKNLKDEVSETMYTTSAEAMADPETRDSLIADAIKQLMAWRRRFRGLRELERLMAAIDETIETLSK